MMNFKFIFFIVAIIVSSSSIANEDIIQGKKSAVICFGCHGVDGNSSQENYPKLAAQGEGYLIKQMMDFKKGRRVEEHMNAMVQAIKETDYKSVAAYFSAQIRRDNKGTVLDLKKAKIIYSQGNVLRSLMSCAGCHGHDAKGVTELRIPSLAGQHAGYINSTLREFKSGKRNNDINGQMRKIAVLLTDEEIDMISLYLSSFKKN